MVSPWIQPIAGKDRFLNVTYDSLPEVIVVNGSYATENAGFYGYLGGIYYMYFLLTGTGQITIMFRNIFASSPGGVAANSGNFDFNLSLIQSLQAKIVYANPWALPIGEVIIGLVGGNVTIQYYQAGVAAALPADATIHFEMVFIKSERTSDTVGGFV